MPPASPLLGPLQRPGVAYRLTRIWRPDVYQGGTRRSHYFEGWYFKLVDRSEENAIAIIPGISLGGGPLGEGRPHSFIQLIIGATGETHYYEFPLEAFRYHPHRFEVVLDRSRFRHDGIELRLRRLTGAAGVLEGSVRFAEPPPRPWPVTLLRPGIMGPYAFAPRMECYHGVTSLDHGLHGALRLDGRRIDFTGGRGYAEKDWGTSFPSSWVWMQSNHFRRLGTSFFISVARIPWLGSHFIGHIAALLHAGELFAFTTYQGSRIEAFAQTADGVAITVTNRRHRLKVRAHRGTEGELKAPRIGAMTGRDEESLDAQVEVELWELPRSRHAERLVFAETGRNTGLEIMDSSGILAADAASPRAGEA